jgi:hypothetical protein
MRTNNSRNNRARQFDNKQANPTILIWKQYCAVIWLSKKGWSYQIKNIATLQSQSVKDSRSISAPNNFKNEKEAVREARSSLAWVAWDSQDGSAVPAIILNEDDRAAFEQNAKKELRRYNNTQVTPVTIEKYLIKPAMCAA